MIQTILGIIILLMPFLLIFCFSDRKRGFLTIFTGFAVFHLILALFTQYLHIFSYSVVLTTCGVVDLVCLFFLLKRHKKFNFEINWFLIVAILIVGFQLWSVHYSYTGLVATANGNRSVTNSSYSYPIFSDEWVGSSLVDFSITEKSLPAVNPLFGNGKFPNLLVPFFSFLSEMFLILNLDPLLGYPVLAIVSGLLLCLFTYFTLISFGVGEVGALLSVLALPLITNGANLPGIWFLMPYLVAMIIYLASLVATTTSDKLIFYTLSILTVIFYPPFIVFVAPTVLVYLYKNYSHKHFLYSALAILGVIAIIVLGLLIIDRNLLVKIWADVLSKITRDNLVGGIPNFNIFYVVPFYILIFSALGLWQAFKNKNYYLLKAMAIGAIFWVVYMYTNKVLIIDGPRVVVITSILLVLCAGYGVDYLLGSAKLKSDSAEVSGIKILLIFSFLIIAVFNSGTAYQKLVLRVNNGGKITRVNPAPPINRYLNEGDLKAFTGITKKIFIAPPWKGLVIGVATHNYPLESKPSIITNAHLSYSYFINSSCADKIKISQKYKNLEYVYSSKFDCPGFEYVTEGGEGMGLYKVK
jgi:hypothetical protein